ncbi:MAG TPA: twin-arginine translocation signal domain-containing protein [Terracidiphilus sp.]|nr:twin-arginine translocation signal domain-containing protein [Terracidiphilus sp.]
MDDRRDFLKSLAVAGLAGLPLVSAAETNNITRVPLTKPVTVNVIDSKEDRDGDRHETVAHIDMIGSNGSVHRTESYTLRIERDDSYDVTSVIRIDKYISASDQSPTDSELRVTIAHADKGDIEGDFRNDEVQVTVIGPEGIMKTPVQSVKKPLIDPWAGPMTPEKAQQIFDSRQRGAPRT